MMETQTGAAPFKWRKFVVSSLVGAAVGFAGTTLLMRFYGDTVTELGGSAIAAGATGLMYLLMAGVLGFGLAMPGLGARFLNFEDEDELREQRRLTTLSTLAIGPMGIALCLLALAGPGGLVSQQAALWGVLAALAVATVLTFLVWKAMDELGREMSRDCGNISYYLLLVFGAGWALLAHLGLVPAPAPLDWVTMFFALPLLAAFVAVGRRGLMTPR